MRINAPWRILKFYLNHPLGRLDRFGTLARIIRWQIGSRALGAEVAMPYVDGTRLLTRTSMHSATGNIYVGFMEFEDMAFVLHLLRKEDAFVDVGANVGIYTILAASRGARVLAIEPVPETYEQLLDNIYLNRFNEQIDARNIGIGAEPGDQLFTTSYGAANHVIVGEKSLEDAVTMTVDSLDEVAAGVYAALVKIDVEGFEAEVIRGASNLLANDSLKAVLIELNGLGIRYGFSDSDIHLKLLEFGFQAAHYDPYARLLIPIDNYKSFGNTLYVRPSVDLNQRLRNARPVIWGRIKF